MLLHVNWQDIRIESSVHLCGVRRILKIFYLGFFSADNDDDNIVVNYIMLENKNLFFAQN